MNFYERALELREETVAHRRWLHRNAEVGLHMPKGQAYVLEQLRNYGLEAYLCGHGVTAELGRKGGRTILLRADMDALPMPDESGESFACPTGTEAHTCGHDLHTAMLLTAAKMLKEKETTLGGRVRFMFQPAEETFEGAKDMLANGILEDVDAALAYHVGSGRIPMGQFMYNRGGIMMYAVDGFEITIHGRGAHGAYPHNAIDPINIGTHIYLALESLIAREADPGKSCVLTIGSFLAGSAPNIIPDTAVLQGTLRTNDKDSREKMVRRLKEVVQKTAEAFGGTAENKTLFEVPPLICNPEMTDELVGYMEELPIPGLNSVPDMSISVSEDFAFIAEKVPSVFMYLSAGYMDERGDAPVHNPKVQFNEEVCPIGSACLAHCAVRWLEEHQ